jgi:hypothetical protein
VVGRWWFFVVEPARRVGLTVEPELVEQVLDDGRDQPGALPLLSAALLRADENREGTTLTLAGYRAGGGVAGALEATAEEGYRRLDGPARSAARILLVRLATREGSEWVRRPLPRAQVERAADDGTRQALAELAERRLLVVGAERVELAHEALLTGWPRLRDWLHERVLAVDLLEHLRTAALAWESAGRPDADLYRGPRLQSALDWRDTHPRDVAPLESTFLDAAAAAAQMQANAEIAAAHARADSEARGRRRLCTVVVALVAAMAVVAAAGIVAVRERSDADQAALTATAGQAAALSQTVPDLTSSLLLATAGYRLQDSAATRSALLAALERSGSLLWRLPTANRILGLAAAGDGTRLYTLDNQRPVTVYALPARTVVATYPIRADALTALSPDGSQLVVEGAAGSGDPNGGGRISVLDARNGDRVQVLPTITSEAREDSSGVFTSDGRWFAVMEAAPSATAKPQFNPDQLGPAVDVYDTAHWAAAPRVLHLPPAATALSAGTADLVVAVADGTLEVVRAADLAVVGRAVRADLRTPAASANPATVQVALAPDDTHLALAAPQATASLLLLDARHPGAACAPDGQRRWNRPSTRQGAALFPWPDDYGCHVELIEADAVP